MSGRSTALLALYQALIEQVKLQYKEEDSPTIKVLYQSILKSKQYLLLKSQADETEIALVEEFLKRDIASFLKEQNADSLSHSPTMIAIENTFWHWLNEITDKSQVEWHELSQDFKHHGCYQSGEIISQGRMVCTECEHEMLIEFPSVISDCPTCDNNEFTREAFLP
ncbi:zinc ribbon-containing protein [Shewanella sp. SR44-3]|uniref:zinc ribbon-containing protein n=1 Tax=unclassified Shewanella TaxID=196818 RepID=UPI0015FCC980|nr:zinc ribbon-containing protein [Shewanella sp. SR44-3]MBB1269492.1 zinc ribbon-containing protein [Shewanella sp. SR44-3]